MSHPEATAIPYESNDLRGERLLVLAPHPDDEVIGCGGLIALHRREQRSVRVVVATDGAEAGEAAAREEESRKGLDIVGGAELEFLRYRDRQLQHALDDCKTRLRAVLTDYKPDLIAVTSPVEIHPDHIALCRALCELVQFDPTLFADLATARVAFYEVSSTIRPNTLLDITSVAQQKYDAVGAHVTQRAFRDYVGYAQGLNAYRCMTLPRECRYAEGYFVLPLPQLRTMPFSALRALVGAPAPIEIVSEPLQISVIVRTKDRPALLAEAIDSIRRGPATAEIVVVNDGGALPSIDGVTLINHERTRGRSEAMNSGVRAAKAPYVAFLDDDDLYYPEHLPTLARAAAKDSQFVAWYTDAVSTFGTERMRIFSEDFDRVLLLLDNYIPLPTLLVRRETFLDAGGFDPAFDLFEDWDFLIRLSRRGDFAHVKQITCEIRRIEGARSILAATPEGSQRFREAKLQVWRKHAELIDNNVIANVLERQKRRLVDLTNDTVLVRGERDHLSSDVARLQREQAQLGKDIASLQGRAAHLDGANTELRNALAAADADRYEKNVRLQDLQAAFNDVTAALNETQRTNAALYAEVGRLQGLLDMIYKSRTWKLHTMVEKMKGRG